MQTILHSSVVLKICPVNPKWSIISLSYLVGWSLEVLMLLCFLVCLYLVSYPKKNNFPHLLWERVAEHLFCIVICFVIVVLIERLCDPQQIGYNTHTSYRVTAS